MQRSLLLPSAGLLNGCAGGWHVLAHASSRPPTLAASPKCPLHSSSSSSVLPGHHHGAARDVRAHGRKDGYSAARKSRSGKRRGGGSSPGSAPDGGGLAWWEEPELDGSGAAPRGQQPSPASTADGRQAQQRRADRRGTFASASGEEQQDETGWWQKPEERSLAAYAPRQLQAWQVERLEKAYAKGRRKVKIQEVAQELGLDRTEVLFWMKEFALRPESEKQAILARHQADVQQEQAAAQQAAPGAGRARIPDPEATAPRPTSTSSAPTALPDPTPQQPSGFIPFYTRKELGLTDQRHRRLPADALRTLEAIYTRTPFPSNEVIRGVWDLHRLPREAVLSWLSARREQDGVLSSEQKRAAAGGVPRRGEAGPDGAEGWSERDDRYVQGLSPAKLREVMGPLAFNSDNMLVSSGSGGGKETPRGAKQQREQQREQAEQEAQPPQVVAVSGRQLAMLKSSLPSPNKFKGKKRNEQMGIKGDGQSLLVGAVQYVEAKPPPTHTVARWVARWRLQKAQQERRLLPLLASEEQA